jgi:pimeloyl-ACP methyl ester carboxylesterase
MTREGLLPHVDVGSGSPVVLLHGFGLDARMWSAHAPSSGGKAWPRRPPTPR